MPTSQGPPPMVKAKHDWVAASVYKSYLYCAAKVIRKRGGIVTAYDGDRVMGVFIGNSKNSNAALCGLNINHIASEIVLARYKKKWPDTTFQLKQRVGIDTSNLFVARTGRQQRLGVGWQRSQQCGEDGSAVPKLSHIRHRRGLIRDSARSQKHSNKNQAPICGQPRDDRTFGYRIYGSTWWRSA